MHLLLCRINSEYRVAHLHMSEGAPTDVGVTLSVMLSHYSLNQLSVAMLRSQKTSDIKALESSPKYIETHNAAEFLELLLKSDEEILSEDMLGFIFNRWVRWCYVIDIDSGTFEIFCNNAGNHNVYPDSRFFSLESEGRKPMIKLAEFPLNQLPDLQQLSHIESILHN